MSFSLQTVWNNELIEKERTVEPRSYIRASEVGTSFRDRYYKMMGVPFTTPFNARTLRVFEAGRLYEWLVRLVLIRAGILRETQTELKIEGDHLPVIGHLDFTTGGKPDWKQADSIIPMLEALHFPTTMMTIADKVIDQINQLYPNGLPELVYDVKSVNSMVFWKHNKNESFVTTYKHHALQVYSYMKALGYKEGRVLYISKDDLTLAETQIIPDELLDNEWGHDIMTMSKYYRNKEVPPAPDYIVWSGSKYEVNWQVSRSNYFSLVTGIAESDREAWLATMVKMVGRCNYRVKEALKKRPDLTRLQLQQLCDPYLNQQLEQLQTGKLQIEKEVELEE